MLEKVRKVYFIGLMFCDNFGSEIFRIRIGYILELKFIMFYG